MVSKKLVFCSYFDFNYLTRFLALKKSLDLYSLKYKYFVLALDNETEVFLKKNFPEINTIKLSNIEKQFTILNRLKKERSRIEYYFTLSPFIPIYIKQNYKIKNLMYLDTDLFFVKNPVQEFIKFKNHSITIIKQKSDPKYGKYNVGLINYNFTFNETLPILNRWKNNCISWCSDYVEKNKYADQKYLDSWPKYSKNILILNPSESMLSPWDKFCCKKINDYITNKIKADWFIFHFHGIIVYKNYFTTGISIYSRIQFRQSIYKFYNNYIGILNSYNHEYNLVTSSSRYDLKNYVKSFFRVFKKIFFSLIRLDLFKLRKNYFHFI